MHEGHRQRLLKKVTKDVSILEEHEVLEALLFYAIPRKDTNAIAQNLLKVCNNNIKSVLEAPKSVVTSVEGVGDAVYAYFQLLSRVMTEYDIDFVPIKVNSYEATDRLLFELYNGVTDEVFYALFLDDKDRCYSVFTLSSNKTTYIKLDLPKFNEAIVVHKPCSIIVAHNHPSGMLRPSAEDDKTTEAIYTMLKLNRVNFYDHVIVSGKSTYSYLKEGYLEKIKEKVDVNFST